MGLAMLRGRDLPWEYWGEAMNIVVHILSWTKTIAIKGKTLYEPYYGKKLTISHLWISGFDAYVHVHKDTRSNPQLKGYLHRIQGLQGL